MSHMGTRAQTCRSGIRERPVVPGARNGGSGGDGISPPGRVMRSGPHTDRDIRPRTAQSTAGHTPRMPRRADHLPRRHLPDYPGLGRSAGGAPDARTARGGLAHACAWRLRATAGRVRREPGSRPGGDAGLAHWLVLVRGPVWLWLGALGAPVLGSGLAAVFDPIQWRDLRRFSGLPTLPWPLTLLALLAIAKPPKRPAGAVGCCPGCCPGSRRSPLPRW